MEGCLIMAGREVCAVVRHSWGCLGAGGESGCGEIHRETQTTTDLSLFSRRRREGASAGARAARVCVTVVAGTLDVAWGCFESGDAVTPQLVPLPGELSTFSSSTNILIVLSLALPARLLSIMTQMSKIRRALVYVGEGWGCGVVWVTPRGWVSGGAARRLFGERVPSGLAVRDGGGVVGRGRSITAVREAARTAPSSRRRRCRYHLPATQLQLPLRSRIVSEDSFNTSSLHEYTDSQGNRLHLSVAAELVMNDNSMERNYVNSAEREIPPFQR
ncbi:hypothetical protein E2C01_003538 [Portunus trituberculatus]|uniref:Uncharacterized protein n=1 Tax=Portunus trituberculatus TaxID=210409 RepID=A0A5B7CQE1_PORTR|nr:hypothetical protein [Portunus trituberculatus]